MSYPGPPPVKPYTGSGELASRRPRYQPILDHGAFRALWELAEASAKRNAGTNAAAALQRAVEALREEYWTKHASERPARRIARRKV